MGACASSEKAHRASPSEECKQVASVSKPVAAPIKDVSKTIVACATTPISKSTSDSLEMSKDVNLSTFISPSMLEGLQMPDLEGLVSGDFGNAESGAFGHVLKYTVAGQDLAVKMLKVEKDSQRKTGEKMFWNELAIHFELSHPNIVTLMGYFVNQSYFFLATDWADEGSCSLLVGRGPVDVGTVLPIVIGVARGMAWMHKKNIIHRDLKLDNILLHNQSAKICDFGLSERCAPGTMFTKRTCTRLVGTPTYMAPEILRLDGYHSSCDVWAFGVSVVELLLGDYPYGQHMATQSSSAHNFAIKSGVKPIMPSSAGTVEGLTDILDSCFLDMDARPTFVQITGALSTCFTKYTKLVVEREQQKQRNRQREQFAHLQKMTSPSTSSSIASPSSSLSLTSQPAGSPSASRLDVSGRGNVFKFDIIQSPRNGVIPDHKTDAILDSGIYKPVIALTTMSRGPDTKNRMFVPQLIPRLRNAATVHGGSSSSYQRHVNATVHGTASAILAPSPKIRSIDDSEHILADAKSIASNVQLDSQSEHSGLKHPSIKAFAQDRVVHLGLSVKVNHKNEKRAHGNNVYQAIQGQSPSINKRTVYLSNVSHNKSNSSISSNSDSEFSSNRSQSHIENIQLMPEKSSDSTRTTTDFIEGGAAKRVVRVGTSSSPYTAYGPPSASFIPPFYASPPSYTYANTNPSSFSKHMPLSEAAISSLSLPPKSRENSNHRPNHHNVPVSC